MIDIGVDEGIAYYSPGLPDVLTSPAGDSCFQAASLFAEIAYFFYGNCRSFVQLIAQQQNLGLGSHLLHLIQPVILCLDERPPVGKRIGNDHEIGS